MSKKTILFITTMAVAVVIGLIIVPLVVNSKDSIDSLPESENHIPDIVQGNNLSIEMEDLFLEKELGVQYLSPHNLPQMIIQPKQTNVGGTIIATNDSSTIPLVTIVAGSSYPTGNPIQRWATGTIANPLSVGYITKNGDFYTSGTIYSSGSSISGHLLPASNNLYDIGEFGTAWKDIYASGTAYINDTTIKGDSTSTFAGSVYIGADTPDRGYANDGTLYVKGTSEFDKIIYADKGIGVGGGYTIANNATTIGSFMPNNAYQTVYAPSFLTGTIGNYFLIAEYADGKKDFDHTQQTHPTLFIHSATDPDINNAEYAALDYDSLTLSDSTATTTIKGDGTTSTFSSDIYPMDHNIFMLGSYTQAWKDIYASGTFYIGDTTFATAGETATSTFTHNIVASSYWIQGTGYASDFVFEDDYPLLTIDEFGEFIDENKHLPNMPSNVDGFYLADQNERLLEAVEVQARYIVELEERISKLEAGTGEVDVEKLKAEIIEELLKDQSVKKISLWQWIKNLFN